MSVAAIRAALETQLNAMVPSILTAWENSAFNPPVSAVPYQQVNILFATPDNPEIGAGYREQGYMQVTLKYPLQNGPSASAARAMAIRSAFPKNAALTNSGVVVTISKTPIIGNGSADGDRWSIPVKIPFHSNLFS